jgi:hypothetical protein
MGLSLGKIGLILSVLSLCQASLLAGPVEVVVNTYTPVPNTSGRFVKLGREPALEAFRNDRASFTCTRMIVPQLLQYDAVFIYDKGSLSEVASGAGVTTSNATINSRHSFRNINASNDYVTFHISAPFNIGGIWSTHNAQLTRRVGMYIIPPLYTRLPSMDGDNIWYIADQVGGMVWLGLTTASQSSINWMQVGGNRQKLVTTNITDAPKYVPRNTPAATDGKFTKLHDLCAQGGYAAFIADTNGTGTRGVYLYESGKVSLVADLKTPFTQFGQANTTLFSDFPTSGGLSYRKDRVAFMAFGSGTQKGIYTYRRGATPTRQTVADTSSVIPGTPFTFNFFEPQVSTDGDRIVFVGGRRVVFGNFTFDLVKGVYAWRSGGGLKKVVDSNTFVDLGLQSKDFHIGPEALSNKRAIFWASYSTGAEGIYIATVPD